MRTTVFFKGCGMRCLWCANPESLSFRPVLTFNPSRCIGCGICLKLCRQGAIYLDDAGAMAFDRRQCTGCGDCADLCCSEARIRFGEEISVEELFRRISQDKYYYHHSGGGVTFSGGEPLLQSAFLTAVAKKCRDNGIHVAIETCGYADYESFQGCLDYLDFIYFDLKHMDSAKHQAITGQGNEKILENLKKIDRHNIEIHVRTPVVPGYNDSRENILATAAFCSGLANVTKYELLAYHKLGVNKYKLLGLDYALADISGPTEAEMDALKDAANTVLGPAGKACIYNKDNDLD